MGGGNEIIRGLLNIYMKPFTISNVVFWMIFSLAACKTKTSVKAEFINPATDTVTNIKSITMKDLVKTYNLLEGQNIETEGIVYYEFENVSICLSNGRDGKCFWLDLNKDLMTNDSLLQRASGQKFILKGTIDNSSKGHLSAYLATIRNVYYLKQK